VTSRCGSRDLHRQDTGLYYLHWQGFCRQANNKVGDQQSSLGARRVPAYGNQEIIPELPVASSSGRKRPACLVGKPAEAG
jgi:hypothetical protein